MDNKKKLAINSGFSFKKLVASLLMFTLICLFTAGCGRRSFANQILKSDKAVQQNQLTQGNNNETQSGSQQHSIGSSGTQTYNIASQNNSKTASNAKMNEVSNTMDSLDNALNGTDNGSDIKTTESIINNIN